jgi:hypothetical protein
MRDLTPSTTGDTKKKIESFLENFAIGSFKGESAAVALSALRGRRFF